MRKLFKSIFASESHSMNLTAAYLLSAFILAVGIFLIGSVQRSKENLRADLKAEYQHNLDVAREDSYKDGYNSGYDAGWDAGCDASDAEHANDYDSGYQDGYGTGYNDGYDEGFYDATEDPSIDPTTNYQLTPNPDGTISVLDKRKSYTVFVTASGQKYHIRTCRTISESDITKTTLGEAEIAGYSPCSICIPSFFYN